MESVRNQNFASFEHLIIDGGSDDGSVQYILQNEKYFSYWLSERDNGIYHAMNKGIKRAKGNYLYFLNSGDFLKCSNVFSILSSKIQLEIHLISFNVEVIINSTDKKIWKTKSNYRFSEIAFGHLPHQGFLFNKSVFQILGYYNENNKIVSDWELFLKAIYHNLTILHLDIVGAVHHFDGISHDFSNLKLQNFERELALQSYLSLYEDLKLIQGRLSMRKEIAHKLSKAFMFLRLSLKPFMKRNN